MHWSVKASAVGCILTFALVEVLFNTKSIDNLHHAFVAIGIVSGVTAVIIAGIQLGRYAKVIVSATHPAVAPISELVVSKQSNGSRRSITQPDGSHTDETNLLAPTVSGAPETNAPPVHQSDVAVEVADSRPATVPDLVELRLVCRLVSFAPICATGSIASLTVPSAAVYIDAGKTVLEAFTAISFFNLLMSFVIQEWTRNTRQVIGSANAVGNTTLASQTSLAWPAVVEMANTSISKAIEKIESGVDPANGGCCGGVSSLRFQQRCLNYVIIKTGRIIARVSFLMKIYFWWTVILFVWIPIAIHMGRYDEPSLKFNQGENFYPITFVTKLLTQIPAVSNMVALMLVSRPYTAEHLAVTKFICIKIVVVINVWQNTIISTVKTLGYLYESDHSIEPDVKGLLLGNCLFSMEMFVLTVIVWHVFQLPSVFQTKRGQGGWRFLFNLDDVWDIVW